MSHASAPPPFRRVLVANRGEIAIRIFRTLREMGIESVAIYSDADRDALHVRYADHAYAIGGELPAQSYLRQDVVLDVAKRAEVDAIHPGYGFLAENADFARACASAGVVFVGPSPEAIDAMGSKTASRELMRAAGVPIVPGSTKPLDSLEDARGVAGEVGYPVAVKARSGGGGKGFRVAMTADELQTAYEGASREGERYFSDGAVYLERYLHDPRHVEVQLLADADGAVIHLGERDCSVQRRHQKLIEECPGPHADGDPMVAAELRRKLGKIAVDAARAVGYTNAGTIECLLGPDGEPFFLEMNTRVQVEHTVTELVTGIDIVAEQLRIAAGLPLRITQEDVRYVGHAIECRINAEDARHDFRPSSGTITRWSEPGGIGVRVDAGFVAGSVVTPFYDTLLAKLVVWAEDRDLAIARMRRALDEFDIAGVETLIDFHRAAMSGDSFPVGGTCRNLVADPVPAIEALPAPVGRGVSSRVRAVRDPEALLVEVDGRRSVVHVHDPSRELPEPPVVRPRIGGAAGAPGEVTAPIPGNVLQVLVKAGQTIAAGQIVCILEAMKMENEIAATASGTVEAVRVEPGEAVAAGHVLVSVAADS